MSAAASFAYKKKSKRGTKKTYSRLTAKARVTKSLNYSDSAVHSFKRMMDPVTMYIGGGGVTLSSDSGTQTWMNLAAGGAGDVGGGPTVVQIGAEMHVTLSNVLQVADFVGLFNQYRIDKVSYTFELEHAASYNPGAASSLPTIYTRYDPNDKLIPATFGALASSGNCKTISFANGNTHTISCVPKPATPMYVAGVSSGYAFPANTKSFWLDTTAPSPDIEHYAYKLWFRGLLAAANAGLGIRVTPMVYMSFQRTH